MARYVIKHQMIWGVAFYISEYGNVRELYVFFQLCQLIYKGSFSTSNYMNSPPFLFVLIVHDFKKIYE